MDVLVIGEQTALQEFRERPLPENINVVYSNNYSIIYHNVDTIFLLLPEEKALAVCIALNTFEGLVVVNGVISTLKHFPVNCCRINAWPGFISRPLLEIATSDKNLHTVNDVFTRLKWPIKTVSDIAGMIAARNVAMIINEAYFALEDKISSRSDMDIAMKLGTNYPYGPFEWGQKIGLKNIYSLLVELAENDKRYTPSALLKMESLS